MIFKGVCKGIVVLSWCDVKGVVCVMKLCVCVLRETCDINGV